MQLSMNQVMNPGVDKAKIKAAAEASHTATITMLALGLRERARVRTNLAAFKAELLKMNEKVVDKDYMDLWRALEAAGAGSIVLGRRGSQTRFEWNYSLKQVAQIAIEGRGAELKRWEDSQRPAVIPEQPKKSAVQAIVKVEVQMSVRTIEVRPGCSVQIVLPRDITAQELLKVTSALIAR